MQRFNTPADRGCAPPPVTHTASGGARRSLLCAGLCALSLIVGLLAVPAAALAQVGSATHTALADAPTRPAASAPRPRVQFRTTLGDFVVELHPEFAPLTVGNFLRYVDDHHYDGTLFHRVIDGFMVQGGGHNQTGDEKPTRQPVVHEGQAAIAKGGARNTRGTLAMARTSDPDSAAAQFFINVVANPRLDPVAIPPGDPVPRFEWMGQVLTQVPRAALEGNLRLKGYTVFGEVVSGMDTIDRIRQTPTGAVAPFEQDAPLTPVVILSATRTTDTAQP